MQFFTVAFMLLGGLYERWAEAGCVPDANNTNATSKRAVNTSRLGVKAAMADRFQCAPENGHTPAGEMVCCGFRFSFYTTSEWEYLLIIQTDHIVIAHRNLLEIDLILELKLSCLLCFGQHENMQTRVPYVQLEYVEY